VLIGIKACHFEVHPRKHEPNPSARCPNWSNGLA
jgi:hypothetical protein